MRVAVAMGAAATVLISICLAPMPSSARKLEEPIVLMWQVTGSNAAADLRTLSALGVNTVQSFPLADEKPEYVAAYLDAAFEANIGVIPFLGMHGRGEKCGLSAADEEFVQRYAGHAAIAAWHSVDEPAANDVSKACQRRLYVRIKELDPTHPVMVSINFATQGRYDEFFAEDAFDVLELHHYGAPRMQRNLIERFRENRKREYPVIVTLRAFNAPAKVAMRDMKPGSLHSQFDLLFGSGRLSPNIGFYGWQLTRNQGINQVDWLGSEFQQLAREKLAARRGR